MASTTYLITGANRGIGLGLVTVLLSRPNTTVIAAVRSPSSTASLSSLPKASGSKLIIVKIDAKVTSDPAAAVTELKSTHNLTQIDVVIANAGISNHYVPAATTSIAEAQEHYEVNFLGPLALFQATLPLLEKSANPKFVGVSTGAATIGNMDKWPVPVTAYGASKVALNFFLRKASMEHPGIVIYPIHPGWVQTEMGRVGGTFMNMGEPPTTVEESADGILKNVDNATKEETSGTFQSFDDIRYSW